MLIKIFAIFVIIIIIIRIIIRIITTVKTGKKFFIPTEKCTRYRK